MAAWYLTIAFGNLIVVIAAEALQLENQVYEYIFFAGLLLLATLIYMVLAYFYKYDKDKNPNKESDEKNEGTKKSNTIVPVKENEEAKI